jgi:hypothetical protein
MRKLLRSIRPLQARSAVNREIGTRIFIIQRKPAHPLRMPVENPSLTSLRRFFIGLSVTR